MSREELVWSDYAFEGKLVQVRVDSVRIEGGPLRQREVVEHPGAVAILPVLDDGRLVLIRQYRHAVGKYLLEVPAGTLEAEESPEQCAIRELAEETGYTSRELNELIRFFVSPGWCNEELVCFLATGLTEGQKDLEDDEKIDTVLVAPGEIVTLIADGQIGDAKTIMAILKWRADASS